MSQLKIKDGNSWIGIPAGGVGVPSGGSSGQYLKKSSSTDYATEWADVPKDWTLLWTNDAPTSNFSAQTVPLTLSAYTEVRVLFAYNTNATATRKMVDAIIDSSTYSFNIVNYSGSSTRMDWRNFSANSNGVAFEDGKTNTTTSASTGIPLKIWAR